MTMSPQAAPTDSRFSRTALSETITERKARASRRNVRPAINAMTSGRLA
jgi:hypothetical protein